MSGDTKFYITSSKAGKSEGPDRHVISESDVNIDTFLSFLPTQEIILSAKPTTGLSKIDDSDPWARWITRVGGEGSAISVGFDDAEKFKIQQLNVTIAQPWSMHFSSSNSAISSSFGDDLAAKIPTPGMREDGSPIYFGLDMDQEFVSIPSTVSQLFELAGMQKRASQIPKELLDQKVSLSKRNAAKKRNGLWFYPDQELQTTLRLCFALGDIDSIGSVLHKVLPDLKVDDAAVIVKKSIASETSDGTSEVTETAHAAFEIQCSVTSGGSTALLMGSLVPVTNGYYLSIKLDTGDQQTADPLGVVISWLVGFLPEGEDFQSVTEILFKKDFFKEHIHLRRIRVDVEKSQLRNVSIDIEISTSSFGQKPGEPSRATFLVSYTWARSLGTYGSLQGRFWNKFDKDELRKLQPEYELFNDIIPITANPAEYIDLPHLIAGETIDSIPSNIPTRLDELSICLSTTAFSVGAGIVSKNTTEPDQAVPQIDFDRAWLEASFEWSDVGKFSLVLETHTMLNLKGQGGDDPAIIRGSLEYHIGEEVED
ncbi:hypothetical protein F66182_2566 [Fusarium sp. NRRL 66182]|nr:hypothetical protein F66182_2566 [Fusarium sp. NRRL 66182]